MIFKARYGEPTKGWVVLVHGLGEHSGRYKELIQELNNAGFAVYAFDWPGHGRSSGKRGHATIEEALEIINEIIEEIGEKPIIFGHSLGGLTVIRYAELFSEKIRGVIASSPALALSPKTPKALVTLAKILGVITPKLTLNNGIDPKLLSRNEEAVKKYVEDPLVHDRISAALARSIFINAEKAHEEAEKISVPILILVGTSDYITPPEGAKRLYNRLKVKDKKLIEYEGAYHEIFEDPEWKEKLFKDIVEWALSHI